MVDLSVFEGLQGSAPLIFSSGLLLAALLVGVLFYWLFLFFGSRFESLPGNALFKRWRRPALFLFPLLMVLFVAPSLKFSPGVLGVLRHLFGICFIVIFAWLLINTTYALRDMILAGYRVEEKDNLKARAIHTQINVIVKIALIIIGVVSAASVLMTFEKIRQVGVSILASAGIIGIIVGFAAQRSIATLLAGIQIAVTQPIRIDDVVIVEGEWGRIEEITLTYVVVRIWDLRRLIVPISHFLEKPFQNWTRISADILGTVFLYVDYTVSVEEIRGQLHELLKQSEYWDGSVWGLQVTNTTERSVELRALMSARDSSSAWNLRCEIREKLLDYIQRNYPQSLPRIRAEVEGESAGQPFSCGERAESGLA